MHVLQVNEILNCGHKLKKRCYKPSICNKICNKINLNCPFRHLCKKTCCVNCDSCIYPISVIMNCGHVSEFLCFQEPYSVECAECTL